MDAGGWRQVRQEARRRRASVLGENGDAPAEAALEAAARWSGLGCHPLPPGDALLSGALAVFDGEAETIWFRADLPPWTRRLVIAHELAHFWLHHEHGSDDACHCAGDDFEESGAETLVGYGPRERREAEANVFAREFLLPVPLLARWFWDEGQSADAIAARTGLPLSAVLSQLADTLLEAPTLAPVPSPAEGTGARALDPSQCAAAHAESGPLLVGAGPGTGKTRTLTERVLFLTRVRGERPESLLALTFSRRAAEEMRERIGAQAPDVARRAWIGTFHAYGLDLLRRYWREAGLPPRPVLLDPVDAYVLLERHLGALPLRALQYLHDPAFPLGDILRQISRSKEAMVSPEAFAARAETSGDERLVEAGLVYAAYEKLLRERGALDFADLVSRPVRLLEENPLLLRAEQARWRHVLVDEYQDVNRAGARLVRLLTTGDGAGLWAVGDLRQCIYAFRGASPANVSAWEADFPSGKRTELGVNYRSRPGLVSVFSAACGEGRRSWQAAREDAGTVTLAVAEDDAVQVEHIARRMHRFAETGHAYGEQVVLCRTRGQSAAMRAALAARGVPVAHEEDGLLGKPDVKDLLSLVSRVMEPGGPARHRVPDLPAGLPPSGDAWEFLARALFCAPGWARRIRDRRGVAGLLALARAFSERAVVAAQDDEDVRRAFLRHVRQVARMGGAPATRIDADDGADAVRVLTVHAAKGLEFPVVFLPNLSEGKFPSRPRPPLLPPLPGEPEAEDEEARLFFVALTRARDHLVLSRAQKYNGRKAGPSPLLACLDGVEGIQREVWEAAALTPVPSPLVPAAAGGRGVPATESTADSREGTPEGVAPGATEVGQAPGTFRPPRSGRPGEGQGAGAVPGAEDAGPPHLEAWEAELYLRCPRRYYYERVLELPGGEPPAYANFKQAVRRALGEPDPPEALAARWAEAGLDPAHPHEPMYRAAAEEIVRSTRAPLQTTEAEPLTVALEHGTISVKPDRVEGPDRLECQTFRRPPKDGKADPEQRHSLLREAAERHNRAGGEVVLHLRYLRSGESVPLSDKPKQRQKHLAAYDGALRGVRSGEFPAAPKDGDECPACPYFFICPA